MEDGISKLPEDIIQHIFSFLTPKEAAQQASLLSKAWFRAWQTCPNLCFDEPHLHKKFNSNLSDDEKFTLKIHREMFLNFVNKVLLNYREHNNRIYELKLKMSVERDSAHLVDEWMKIAAESGLKKLQVYTYQSRYTLPHTVLENKSLEGLDLKWCKLEQRVTEGVICHNLRQLVLTFVDLRDEVLQKILSNNRLIEDLEICLCKGLRKIKVTNLGKLKKLFVRYGGMQNLEIQVPNIEFFKCENVACRESTKPCFLNEFAYRNLKLLVLVGIGITDMYFFRLALKFPHLEDLTISRCRALHRLQIASKSLRFIKLEYNKNLEELQFDVPNIVRFEYLGNIIPRVSFTGGSSNWQSKIVMSCLYMIDASWFFKMKGLLTNLIPSKIFLEMKSIGDVTFNAYEIRDNLVNPGPEIGNLSLYLTRSDPAIFSALLDGCFWMCRPQIIQEWWFLNATVDFTKFLYKMLMDCRNQDHLNFQETKFWQKGLKEVKVVSLKRTGKELQQELFTWLKRTGTEWQPELLDWKLKADSDCVDGRTLIHFHLEW